MANDLNKHQCIGRLGQAPDIKYTQDGKAIANLSIACSEQWKDKSGQKQEKTEWIRYVAFGKLAEIMGQYLDKGSLVYLSGKLTTRKWQDQSGQDRYTTEIVANEMQMLGGNQNANAGQQQPPQQNHQQPQQRPQQAPQAAAQGPAGGDNTWDHDSPF